jgi:hypothetical protein
MESKKDKTEALAARMLPDLIARRFDYGFGGERDDFFVSWALKLAKKIVEGKVNRKYGVA